MRGSEGQTILEGGLAVVDLVPGAGEALVSGKTIKVHYTGWLDAGSGEKGKQFDSSVARGEPFSVPIGQGKVIKGWDRGLIGMKVGGKRRLLIPAHMAYGERGYPGLIPPNAALIFEVELLEVM